MAFDFCAWTYMYVCILMGVHVTWGTGMYTTHRLSIGITKIYFIFLALRTTPASNKIASDLSKVDNVIDR